MSGGLWSLLQEPQYLFPEFNRRSMSPMRGDVKKKLLCPLREIDRCFLHPARPQSKTLFAGCTPDKAWPVDILFSVRP